VIGWAIIHVIGWTIIHVRKSNVIGWTTISESNDYT
jgi:hypothetical protein